MKEATVQTLTKHAERYGTEFVMESALEEGLHFADLVQLQKNLDEIEGKRTRKPKPRISAENRVKKLIGLDEDLAEEGA